MKNKYDILVVGSGTAGIYFASKMAEYGYSVCVIDSLAQDKLGERLNIFHIDKIKFAEHGIPEPKPGDEDWINEFPYSTNKSALDKYPKQAQYTYTVSLLPKFLIRLRKWAETKGVEFCYSTSFQNFIFNEKKCIVGAIVNHSGKDVEVTTRLVADCSGIPSVARRKLPNECTVENFEISSRDMFYVILRYVILDNPEKDKIDHTTSWPFYKTWIAPSLDKRGAIYGVGANLSFAYAEKCYANFIKTIKLPACKLDHIEKGFTPYHRSPYSLVTDGFICMGDAACMTKPYSGEGITAAWTFCKIAAEVASKAMINGAYPTEATLWEANVRYNVGQGADFANLMATLVNAIDCTPKENDYEFRHNIIFSTKALSSMNRNFNADMSGWDTFKLAFKILGGLLSGGIKVKTIKGLLKGLGVASKLKKHYKNFPKTPEAFYQWKIKGDDLWSKAGSMADKIEQVK